MLKVGTICIGQNCTLRPEYNGAEGQVIGALQPRNLRALGAAPRRFGVMTYEVRWTDGFVTSAEPHQIRPKFPPAETAVTGELAILNLFKETVAS